MIKLFNDPMTMLMSLMFLSSSFLVSISMANIYSDNKCQCNQDLAKHKQMKLINCYLMVKCLLDGAVY